MPELVAKIGRAKYETTLTTPRHDFIGDEPISLGTDLGPTPYEYLLGALGSCVAITIRMYADRKEWDLEEVEVHLSQKRIHAKDCSECDSDDGFVHVIKKKLKFKGNLTEEQRERLLKISDKCPVNRTLLNEIKIKTEMME